MTTLRLVLADQLTLTLPIFTQATKTKDRFLLAEVREEATYVKHHKKKITLLFSAMRHFAKNLKDDNFHVSYIKYDDANNQGTLLGQIKLMLKEGNYERVAVTFPGEYRLYKSMQQWSAQLGIPVDILEDNRFFSSPAAFTEWAKDRKSLRMEFFYREIRKQTGYLMEDGTPIGGAWNYDSENRESLPADKKIPSPTRFKPDDITQDVMRLVECSFDGHFGDLEPFQYAVTRNQAVQVLDAFIKERLPDFGSYQDAMKEGSPWLFHSHLSFYLNCGLLVAKEVVDKAQQAYFDGYAPLNAVEGFIRQIIGWREFIRGFYWHFMPGLKKDNYFNAKRSLPAFFWSGETNMNCLRQCIKETKEHAYAHHIQRLMVLGNFSLLTELNPDEVQAWYLLVYADAYEWVELPNVSSMILYADGGNLASKPYAASGSYINKMSNYCKNCGYSVSKKHGEKACPFNFLYWRFIEINKSKLKHNPRMSLIYKSYQRLTDSNLTAMRESAVEFLSRLSKEDEV